MTSSARTSDTSPLAIAELRIEASSACLGLTICPGKKDRWAGWDRDLHKDLRAIRDWGASTVVTLIEDHEFRLLGIETLGAQVGRNAMEWVHLPIRDVDAPDIRFDSAWETQGPALHRRIDNGERILIHCRGGLGRTGLVAALILVERGADPHEAIERVREVRPHAVETRERERYVLSRVRED